MKNDEKANRKVVWNSRKVDGGLTKMTPSDCSGYMSRSPAPLGYISLHADETLDPENKLHRTDAGFDPENKSHRTDETSNREENAPLGEITIESGVLTIRPESEKQIGGRETQSRKAKTEESLEVLNVSSYEPQNYEKPSVSDEKEEEIEDEFEFLEKQWEEDEKEMKLQFGMCALNVQEVCDLQEMVRMRNDRSGFFRRCNEVSRMNDDARKEKKRQEKLLQQHQGSEKGDEREKVFELFSVLSSGKKEQDAIVAAGIEHANDGKTVPIRQRETSGFPTTKRPINRKLSEASEQEIDEWFEQSEITIGKIADSPEKIALVKRLLYTWKDAFIKKLEELTGSTLVEHTIELMPDAKPKKMRQIRYSKAQIDFANKMFPMMEKAGILIRGSSEWNAPTLFPPKKPGSKEFRMVNNFKDINKWTIKSAYPMHIMDEVIQTLMQRMFGCFCSTDASNGYWALFIKMLDRYKAAITGPHGNYMYNRMGQGLKGSASTFCQYTDIAFGDLPETITHNAMPTLIGHHGKFAFMPFVDDQNMASVDFDSMLEFLHEHYFPRVIWAPLFLSGKKSFFFMDNLDFIGFSGGGNQNSTTLFTLVRRGLWTQRFHIGCSRKGRNAMRVKLEKSSWYKMTRNMVGGK